MDAPSQLAEVNSPTIPPALHIHETFYPSDECDIYDANLIQTILLKSYHHSFIYADKYPELPLPASYMSPRASMDSIHHIILETDINRPPQELPFPHYIDCPPKQSAKIPLPHYIPVFGYFSRNIPGCFVTTSEGFKRGILLDWEVLRHKHILSLSVYSKGYKNWSMIRKLFKTTSYSGSWIDNN